MPHLYKFRNFSVYHVRHREVKRRPSRIWKYDLQKCFSSFENISNLLLALGACDEDAFPNIHRLLLTACTLPISSAEAERSFSLMKRIKTCTRSTMSEERFSDLAVIAMHYPERFEVDEICEAFVKAHPRRLFQATLFD